MDKPGIQVREMLPEEVHLIVDYFHAATPEFLAGMGVDPEKLPERQEWIRKLENELAKSIEDKQFFVLLWLLQDRPVGHSNISHIKFGQEAFMHLHLWHGQHRAKGLGTAFLRESIPVYFEKFRLKELYCEPYALNPAPNRTLNRLGFTFLKRYSTTPGYLNHPQEVCRYRLDRETFSTIYQIQKP